MKSPQILLLAVLTLGGVASTLRAAAIPSIADAGDYSASFDTQYNSLTVEKVGSVVELRARSRRGEFLESAVDLKDPLTMQVAYTRTLYAAVFFQPNPQRALIVGLGGAGFHRLFAASYPDAVLQTAELDPKVFELCQSALDFKPTDKTPVTLMDGRMFVKRDTAKYDWIILDAFRGGYVPPHLKTEEFYRECAARLTDQGVFISNLHQGTELYFSDIKTIMAVFPQVVLFNPPESGNVIAFAVNYKTPVITDSSNWGAPGTLGKVFGGKLDLVKVRTEHIPIPTKDLVDAKVLTDDFAPVEFLDTVKTNNTAPNK